MGRIFRKLQLVSGIDLYCLICVAALVTGTGAVAGENYPNGFPGNVDFFPIGVWLQSPARAPAYKAIGVNTYVNLWHGPTERQLADLAKYGMFVIASQNDVALRSPNRAVIKAWLHQDEPDNAQPIGLGLYGTCIPATEVVRRTHTMKARDPTRPVMLNFGQGVANEYWNGRGPCTNDRSYYSIAARDVDILSFDIYPVGSKTPQVKGKLEYVARGVARLKSIATSDQKVWAVIETTALDPGHTVTPAQLRAEVWMAIIHGARGIVYFVHEFLPTFREDGIFRHVDIVREVSKENKLIKSMAPILNIPNLSGVVTVQSTVPVDTLVKRYENKIYIFAVSMANKASQPRFTLKGLDATKALVVDEDRTLTITRSAFQNSFDGYGVHIYEVPLRSSDN